MNQCLRQPHMRGLTGRLQYVAWQRWVSRSCTSLNQPFRLARIIRSIHVHGSLIAFAPSIFTARSHKTPNLQVRLAHLVCPIHNFGSLYSNARLQDSARSNMPLNHLIRLALKLRSIVVPGSLSKHAQSDSPARSVSMLDQRIRLAQRICSISIFGSLHRQRSIIYFGSIFLFVATLAGFNEIHMVQVRYHVGLAQLLAKPAQVSLRRPVI